MKNNNFKSSEQYYDGKYKLVNILNGKRDLRRLICESDGICIIPFDTNGEKIKNVYLARYADYLNEDIQDHTCITIDSKKDGEHDSEFDELHSIIKEELNIDASVDDVYYLGKIRHTLPFTKSYKCYALNLDDYSKDLTGFTIDISDEEHSSRIYTLDKVKLTRLLNGDIEDSLAMSAALLLISYIDQ